MRSISLILVALLQAPTTNSRQMPPITGKFFYTDFENVVIEGMHDVKTEVGSMKSSHKLWITTHESRVGLISTRCSRSSCFVSKKFDVNKSRTKKQITTGNYNSEEVDHYNSRDLKKVTFTGKVYEDDFVFKYEKYDRQTVIRQRFLLIDRVSERYTSYYDGFIGI